MSRIPFDATVPDAEEHPLPHTNVGREPDTDHAISLDATSHHSEAVEDHAAVTTGTLHPDARRLYSCCGGKLRWIAKVPIFGPSITAYGPKFITALNVSELFSKGIANNVIQYSYQPMFMDRFMCTTVSYQRYSNVAMMGWNIKPLMALMSDSLALGGYKKRWYMVISALLGAACCFGYGFLPAKKSSGPIAAVLTFLAGMCMANLDILSEGAYSRLIRRVPESGPALVSTVWWMLNIGGIIGAFIQGTLSDGDSARTGGYVACAFMAATVPLFVINWFCEDKNVVERVADFKVLREIEEEKEAARREEAERNMEVDEAAVARKNEALLLSFTANTVTADQLPTDSANLDDLVGFSNTLPDLREASDSDELAPHPLTDCDIEDEVRRTMVTLCGGVAEFNKEVMMRNYRVTIYAVVMSICVVALAVVTTLFGTYPILFSCIGITFLLAGISFWALPVVVAKANLFAFLQTMFYIQITAPLNNFYLAGDDCVPRGPHFSYFFYNAFSSVIGNLAGVAGVTAFAYIFSKRSYRLTFVITTSADIIGSIFDLIMVKRWNIYIGIPDHFMYMWGDAVVYNVAYFLNWMPMVILLSRLCPRGSEAIVYSVLAAFSNLGSTMASELGVVLMSTVFKVQSVVPCNFDNLPMLIVVSHLLAPMLTYPLIFLLIPAARVCDELDDEGHVILPKSKNTTTGAGGEDDDIVALDNSEQSEEAPQRRGSLSSLSSVEDANTNAYFRPLQSLTVFAGQSTTPRPPHAREEQEEAPVRGGGGEPISAGDSDDELSSM